MYGCVVLWGLEWQGQVLCDVALESRCVQGHSTLHRCGYGTGIRYGYR
ncbi:hypothetical protein A2U01_0048466, partial [Trifolium medium]|nr:hypothetical protein [Trifolium medium]